MNIAIIGPRIFPANSAAVSGLEIRSEEVVRSLSKRHHVYIFTRSWTTSHIPKDLPDTVHLIRVFSPKNTTFDTLIYSVIATAYALLLFCDLYMYEGTGSTSMLPIVRLFNKKIIFTIHSQEWQRLKWSPIAKWYLKMLETCSVRLSHRVITVSRSLSKYINIAYKKPCVLILYHRISKPSNTSPSLLKKYDLKSQKYILYLGRLTPEKRIEWLIRAHQELKLKQKLVIAGSENTNYHYKNKIVSMAKITPNIIFTGHVAGTLKETLLMYCDLFVLPSTTEGLPTALIEAMSYNRKILTSDLPEHELLIHRTKFLFKDDDYNDFKRKLQKLVGSGSLKVEYSGLSELPSVSQFNQSYEKLVQDIQNN